MKNEGLTGQGEAGQGGAGEAGGEVVARPAVALWRRLVRAAFWVAVAGTVLSFVCPPMLERTDWLSVAVSHAACMGRTFGMQLGGVCVALTLVLWVARARRVGVGALVLAAVWLVPEGWKFVRPIGDAKEANGRETLTVVTMNVCFGSSSIAAIEREVAACGSGGADVVVFQEFTPSLGRELKGKMAAYPYRVESAREDAYGQAVFSRWPLVGEAERRGVPGRERITVGVRFDGGVVRVTDVHLVSPISVERILDQRRETVGLADEVRGGVADGSGERVLAGDFNATGDGAIIKAVLAAGVRDAWVEGAQGRGGTWPARDLRCLLGRVRIDHILHSDGLVCVGAGVGGWTGSDHLPTWARFVRRR